MSFVEGQSLDTAWETYDSITRNQVTNQLKEYLHELRQISHRNYIGSVDFGPVTDPILESHRGICCPFTCVAAEYARLVIIYLICQL